MKTTLAVFLAILSLSQAAEPTYNLNLRVLASDNPKDETRLAQLSEDKSFVLYTIPNIEVHPGEKATIRILPDQRLSPHPDKNTSESCEILVTPQPNDNYNIACEWFISKKGNAISTEERPYSVHVTLDKWGFTHYGQADAKGSERYLGFQLLKK